MNGEDGMSGMRTEDVVRGLRHGRFVEDRGQDERRTLDDCAALPCHTPNAIGASRYATSPATTTAAMTTS